jgi:hypothetical protein
MHNVQMIESNKGATQQWMTPGHMMNEPTITRKLNGWNLLRSLHDQMCHQPPHYCCHVAELLLPFSISYYVTLCVTEILIKSLNLQLCHKVEANQVVKVWNQK